MSRPPLNPEKTAAGIAVDPRTLDRVIPESKRPDGSVRKQIRIRPGYTPQEDIRRFRGTKQAQMDANALPKGHIIGWSPSPAVKPGADGGKKSAAAKKNEKRRAKKKEEAVRDNWEDDDDEGEGDMGGQKTPITESAAPKDISSRNTDVSHEVSVSNPPSTTSMDTEITTKGKPKSKATGSIADRLASELEKLDVRR